MNRALVLLALLHLGIAGCQRGTGAEAGTNHPGAAAVRVRAVEERVFNETLAAPGQWRSVGEVVVNAPVNGILDSLAVRPGDRVTKGQYLGRLTTRESLASMRGAVLLGREAGSETARAEAERALAIARRELVHVPMTAARAGVVVRVTATAGSDLAEGGEIAAIVPDDGIVFEARVDPAGAARVRIGQRAMIADGSATPHTGVVSRVLPFAGDADQRTLFWLAPGTLVVTEGQRGLPDSTRVRWGS